MEAVLFIVILFVVCGWGICGMYVLPFAVAAVAYVVSSSINESLFKRFSKKSVYKVVAVTCILFFVFSVILSLRFPKEFSSMSFCRDYLPFLNVTFY